MKGRVVTSFLRAGLHRAGLELSRYPAATPYAVHLRELLDALRVACVLDVGAHQGEFGSLLRRVGYRGRIISFEPQVDAFARLADRARRDPAWDVRRVAVGDRAAERELNLAADSDLASFLAPTAAGIESFGTRIQSTRRETVATVRLDAVDFPAGAFLKTDTQGFDLHVLRGAGERMADVSGVQAEAAVVPAYVGAATLVDLLAHMEQAGFVFTGLFPVKRDGKTLALLEADCLWRRAVTQPPE